MVASQTITFDLAGPASVTLSVDGGAEETESRSVTAAVGTADQVTAGYEMKLWGDLDVASGIANGLLAAGALAAAEADALWVPYLASRSVLLSAGDGWKSLSVRLRDATRNPSAVATDAVYLSEAFAAVVSVLAPTAAAVSKQAGADSTQISWSSDLPFAEYKVKVVPTADALHDEGAAIGVAGGSTNVAGAAGGYPANTPIVTTVRGADLEAASPNSGAKIVKVFVRDAAGKWST